MSDITYAELAKQAEQAVKGVTDPELRRIAFEKILSALLAKSESVGKKSPDAKPAIKHVPASKESKKSKKLSGPKAYLREMYDDGFFKKPKSIAQVKAELENRGHHIAITSLSGPLQSLCQEKVLRRQRTQTQSRKGKLRTAFAYSEW